MEDRQKQWKESISVTDRKMRAMTVRLLSSSLGLARHLTRRHAHSVDSRCEESTNQPQSSTTQHGNKEGTGSDFYVCSKCTRPQVEMPTVVSFNSLKTVDGDNEVAALWVPEVAALCGKCMVDVNNGEPLERPDGKADGNEATNDKTREAIGFQAPGEYICTCSA